MDLRVTAGRLSVPVNIWCAGSFDAEQTHCRLLLNHERHQDSWPPEEKNSNQGQRRGVISLTPSDVYVRSFLYLCYTLIKLFIT